MSRFAAPARHREVDVVGERMQPRQRIRVATVDRASGGHVILRARLLRIACPTLRTFRRIAAAARLARLGLIVLACATVGARALRRVATAMQPQRGGVGVALRLARTGTPRRE